MLEPPAPSRAATENGPLETSAIAAADEVQLLPAVANCLTPPVRSVRVQKQGQGVEEVGRHVRTLRFLESSQNCCKLIPKAWKVSACRERHHEVDVVITHERILPPGERDPNSCP